MKNQRSQEEILRAEEEKRFRHDQKVAARLIIEDLAKSNELNQLKSVDLAQVRDTAALDGNRMLVRLSHEILKLRRVLVKRDRMINQITNAVRRNGKHPRAKDANGVDRSVIELRRLARRARKARERQLETWGGH